MKLTEKMKKNLAILGGVLIGIGLIAAIGMQFGRAPQTDQTTQSIQPKPTKPEPPSKEILTDPTQKPDGTKQDTPPVPVDHEAVEKPSEPVADPEQPQAGDTSGNQIYVPGFGWVENHGGGGSGTAAEDMYENGNKIGIMD